MSSIINEAFITSSPFTKSNFGNKLNIINTGNIMSTNNPIVDTGINILSEAAVGQVNSALGTNFSKEDAINVFNTIKGVMGANSGGDGGIEIGKTDSSLVASQSGIGRLDYLSAPIEVQIDTGLNPNGYNSMYRDVVGSQYSPLHLTCAEIVFPSSQTNQNIYKYFDNIVTPTLSTAIQANVSFSVNSSLMTTSSFMNYFQTIADSYATFLFYDSVLTFTSDPFNKNSGMEYLRSKITADNIQSLNDLRHLLGGIPIPPNLKKLIYWFNQSYNYSSIAGSSIIKFCPNTIVNSGSLYYPNNGAIANAVTNIKTVASMANLLATAFPDWVKGDVPSSNMKALHDPNFTSLWANMSISAQYTGGTGTVQSPTTGNVCPFGSFTPNLDGAVTALIPFYDNTNTAWSPNLVNASSSPYSDGSRSNQWSYAYVTGVGNTLIPSHVQSGLNTQAGRTFTLNGQVITGSPPPGTEYIFGVDNNSTSQTSYSILDWCMSLGSVGVLKPKSRVYDNRFSRKGDQNRKKGKSKSPKRNN